MENKEKRVRRYAEILKDEHIPEVASIEKLCFSSPWSEKSLELLTHDGIGVGMVSKADGKVCAYGGMLCVLDEGQITNIATHPDYRRQGYAAGVLDALIKYARNNKFSLITLEVRESNKGAIALYTSCGFTVVGKRKDFYTKPTESGLIMELRLK